MATIKEGLKNSLNAIREISSEIYHQYIPIITDTTDIGAFASPILENIEIRNEFIHALINRIAYTAFEIKYFRNPLQILEGDNIPLGERGQEIYVNPVKGRRFNVEDFAGLLQKYEADVKVQYHDLNMDVQYPISISRNQLRTAFISWDNLNTFIDSLTNSLYNGAYIDEYRFTKNIISGAYKDNKAVIEQVSGISTEAQAKDFITKARTYYLNFQTPSSKYNAWSKVGGYGRPIVTWTNPEDIVFIVRNDIRAYLDVNVLATAFNIASTDLLGRIITVDNFDVYDDDGNKIFDGSNIIGLISDRSWFRIKRQDMFMESFNNANNRSINYYLNLIKMYNYSLFANGVIFATHLPDVPVVSLDFQAPEGITISGVGEKEGLDITVNPVNATTPITYTSSDEDVFIVDSSPANDRHTTITAIGAGTATLTATAGTVTGTVEVTVTE